MASQQMLLGAGSVTTVLPAIDNVFSTYAYIGNGAANRVINNNINLSGQGGLIWTKARSNSTDHILTDTVRGVTKRLITNGTAAQATETNDIGSFDKDGYKTNAGGSTNSSGADYISYTFRKAPGFFDIVQYTGNGSSRNISHSLGCIPGMIFVKKISGTEEWAVYHREVPDSYLMLNQSNAASSNNTFWNLGHSSTAFGIGTNSYVNNNGDDYIAYLFAGGSSTASTARSVYFAGSNDELNCSEAYIPNTDSSTNFCLETWFRTPEAGNWNVLYGQYTGSATGRMFFGVDDHKVRLEVPSGMVGAFSTGVNSVGNNQWYHVAWTFDGTTHRLFLNGELKDTTTPSNLNTGLDSGNPRLGGIPDYPSYDFEGHMSNFRITHGQAVYTSSFIPSTTPLTTTSQGVSGSNCKLLCCNNSTVTNNDGSSGTLSIESGGTVTASTDSPFIDPNVYKLGDTENQEGVKAGIYKGNLSANGIAIHLGWEPQWLMIKRSDSAEGWVIWDTIRGLTSYGGSSTDDSVDERFEANTNAGESANNYLELTPTGFLPTTSNSTLNASSKYVYLAIRRPDGYIGSTISEGVDAFAMDTGSASATIPEFDSTFPVDFGVYRVPTTTDNWFCGARLGGAKYMKVHDTDAEGSDGDTVFDSNVGWQKAQATNRQSWMWKRHAGFDMLTYTGNGKAGREMPHSLGKTPEMMWVKCRSGDESWIVYHKGLNGGTNPEQKYMKLNTTNAQYDDTHWNDKAPSSSHFTLGNDSSVNANNAKYLALLFASVAGVSKVGYYDGSDSAQTITTGFQPRFVIIKKYTTTGTNWVVLDTTRGWGSGDDKWLKLDSTDAQVTYDLGAPTSTGFTLVGGSPTNTNISGEKFIYYAHA